MDTLCKTGDPHRLPDDGRLVCSRCRKRPQNWYEAKKWWQRAIDEKHGGVVDAKEPCRKCGKVYGWPYPGNPEGICAHCTDGVSRSWSALETRRDDLRLEARGSTLARKFGIYWRPECGDIFCDGTCDNPQCVLPESVKAKLWEKPPKQNKYKLAAVRWKKPALLMLSLGWLLWVLVISKSILGWTL